MANGTGAGNISCTENKHKSNRAHCSSTRAMDSICMGWLWHCHSVSSGSDCYYMQQLTGGNGDATVNDNSNGNGQNWCTQMQRQWRRALRHRGSGIANSHKSGDSKMMQQAMAGEYLKILKIQQSTSD